MNAHPAFLVVLGVRGSGTGCLTRVLNLMGANRELAPGDGEAGLGVHVRCGNADAGAPAALQDHSVIACVRHPLSVARSLERRDGLPLVDGVDLWYAYNRRLLDCTAQAPRVYWFDFDAGAAGVRRLIHRLTADFPLEASPAALSHYDSSLVHHHDTVYMSGKAGQLHDLMRLRVRADERSAFAAAAARTRSAAYA